MKTITTQHTDSQATTSFSSSARSFHSRRSVVMSPNGMVACSHPLAGQIGIDLLKAGGHAVDAAIGVAAALGVVEPMSTGIGGDAFALVWQASESRLYAINGSGRAPVKATLEYYRKRDFVHMPKQGILSATVPGAVDAWCTLMEKFGHLTLDQVLGPSIRYAQDGFPVAEFVAGSWKNSQSKLSRYPETTRAFLQHGRAPMAGEPFRLPSLARSLELIAHGGREEFYRGAISREIASFCKNNGGLITETDLANHTSTWVTPINVNYRGYDVYECPPNGQGLAALIALNILEGSEIAGMGHNSGPYLHELIEAMKLGFSAADDYVADPDQSEIPLDELLSKDYATARRSTIQSDTAANPTIGQLDRSSDTVYFTVIDSNRNAVSFISSLYHGFGSGVTAGDTGILLQNRGTGFTLDPRHPNCISPGKRPYHTIIPSAIFKDGQPVWFYGVMGGHMQP
ncbi:MAG: gamma-glutamyltransferase, partial [Gammaproteobacteria bacterium]|nr:gamma-glutamyltransferase [Gammaproteobacteria bacterium]